MMRPSLVFLGALGVLAVPLFTSPALAKDRPPHPRQAEIDSLFQAAQKALDAGDARDALPFLRQVSDIDPRNDRAHCRTGDALLMLKNPEEAEKAFRKALAIRLSPEAYDGIGRVLMLGNKVRTRQAIDYFRDALVRDGNYDEAYVHIAEAAWKLKDLDAKRAMDEAVRRNPDDARVHLLLAEWYQYPPADLPRAIQWYERCLRRRPDDADIAHRLGDLYLRDSQFEKARDLSASLLSRRPDHVRELPVLALSYLGRGDLRATDSLFAVYLRTVNATERSYYDDIRYIGTQKEIQAFAATTTPEERQEFLRRFWETRNPTPADDANRRLLEHYRRVYIARTRFSEKNTPWDRRGEVYIRYGEPDFKGRSDEVNFRQTLDPRVERIKNNLRMALYGTPAPTYGSGFEKTSISRMGLREVSPGGFEQAANEGALGFGPVYPVRSIATLEKSAPGTWMAGVLERGGSKSVASGGDSQVPWETWTYFSLEGGIEITFTDERMVGDYDYAPIPFDTPARGANIRLLTNAPQVVMQKTVARTPDLFRQEVPGHIVFAACPASFRGSGGKARVEVYTALPVSEVRYANRDSLRIASIERRIAILDTTMRAAGRMRGDLAFTDSVTAGVGRGAFLLGVKTFDVPEGDYLLAVQMTDRTTGRMQASRQGFRVDRFGSERLQISDLVLAAQILPDTGAPPLVKNGLRIVPMPSRTYASDQSLFLYCEVYNLKRDAYGQTRYRVDYTVRSKKGSLSPNLFASFGRLIRKDQKKDETTVSYEFVGMIADPHLHLELDIREVGTGDHTLHVIVTDLNADAKSERETPFWIKK